MTTKIVITELLQTCGACPAQWEGMTAGGQYIYIRYRSGRLTVGIGATDSEAVDKSIHEPLVECRVGLYADGFMTTEEMQMYLGRLLDFPAVTDGANQLFNELLAACNAILPIIDNDFADGTSNYSPMYRKAYNMILRAVAKAERWDFEPDYVSEEASV